MKERKIRVLVIDDEIAEDIKENLEDFIFHNARLVIDHVETCEGAEQKIEEQKRTKSFYDILIVDMKMGSSPDSDEKGLEILKLSESALKIVLTGQPRIENCLKSIKAGAYDYIGKIDNDPYERLMNSIREGLEERLNPKASPMQIWLSENLTSLQDDYKGTHIAVIDGVGVDSGRDLSKLQKRVKDKFPFLTPFFTICPSNS